jgi:hypothetical protein
MTSSSLNKINRPFVAIERMPTAAFRRFRRQPASPGVCLASPHGGMFGRSPRLTAVWRSRHLRLPSQLAISRRSSRITWATAAHHPGTHAARHFVPRYVSAAASAVPPLTSRSISSRHTSRSRLPALTPALAKRSRRAPSAQIATAVASRRLPHLTAVSAPCSFACRNSSARATRPAALASGGVVKLSAVSCVQKCWIASGGVDGGACMLTVSAV